MFSACIDCKSRYVEVDEGTGEVRVCHTECPDYIEASRLHQELKDKKDKIKSEERIYLGVQSRSFIRCGGTVSEV